MSNITDKERITEILKAYTKKHNISASVVILEEYAEELIANGVIVQKQGEWIYKEFFGIEFPECSVCGIQLEDANCEDYSYCPECGAKLKELG